MSNELIHAELIRVLISMGMTPEPAKRHASLAFQNGAVHEWPDGQISTQMDGRIDTSSQALQTLAARIVGGAPAAERKGALSYEEKRALRDDKLQRQGGDYSF